MRPSRLLLSVGTASLVQAVVIQQRSTYTNMLLKRVDANTLSGNFGVTYYNTDEVPFGFGTSVTFPQVNDGFRISLRDSGAEHLCLEWLPITGLIQISPCDQQTASATQTPFIIACAAELAADGARLCAFYYGALSEKRCVGAGSGENGVVQLPPEQCLPNDPASWALYKIKKLEQSA